MPAAEIIMHTAEIEMVETKFWRVKGRSNFILTPVDQLPSANGSARQWTQHLAFDCNHYDNWSKGVADVAVRGRG